MINVLRGEGQADVSKPHGLLCEDATRQLDLDEDEGPVRRNWGNPRSSRNFVVLTP